MVGWLKKWAKQPSIVSEMDNKTNCIDMRPTTPESSPLYHHAKPYIWSTIAHVILQARFRNSNKTNNIWSHVLFINLDISRKIRWWIQNIRKFKKLHNKNMVNIKIDLRYFNISSFIEHWTSCLINQSDWCVVESSFFMMTSSNGTIFEVTGHL